MTAQALSIPVAQATNPAIVQGAMTQSGARNAASPTANADAGVQAGSTGAFSAALQASGGARPSKTDSQLNQSETVPGLSPLQYSPLDRSRIWLPLAVPVTPANGSDLLKSAVEELALNRDFSGQGLPLAGKALPPVDTLPVEPPKTLADFQALGIERPLQSNTPAVQIQPGRNLILPGTDHPTDLPLPEQARAADVLARVAAAGVGGSSQVTQPGEAIAERLSAFERNQIAGESGNREMTLRTLDLTTKQSLDTRGDAGQQFARILGADSSANALANFQANSWANSLSSSPANTLVNSLASYASNAPSGPLQDTGNLTQVLRQPMLQPLADQAAWTKGLGDRMLTMSENGVHTARIKLYPEQLGQLEVRIQLEQNTAKVWFTANHGQTREALESSMPQLKEMFQEQGLSLIQAEVDTQQQEQPDRGDDQNPVNRRSDNPEPTISAALLTLTAPTNRLLDVVV